VRSFVVVGTGMIVLQFSTYKTYFNLLFHRYLPDIKPTNQIDMQYDERSLLFGPPSHRPHDNLGHKDEFSTAIVYTTIFMVLRYGKCATKRTFVHIILDSLLWACLSVLK
jgi:hypothetical protein